MAEEDEEEDGTVHLAPNSADDAPGITNLTQETSGDKNARPSGRLLGVIRRNWHSYCESLEPMSLPAGSGGTAHTLFVSKDRRIPKIRINTRQLQMLLDMRIVVAVDSWDLQSQLSFWPLCSTNRQNW